MLEFLTSMWPWSLTFVAGFGIAIFVTEKIPEHAKKVTAGAWVVAGLAVGTAIAPGVGTVIGGVVGAAIAWWTY